MPFTASSLTQRLADACSETIVNAAVLRQRFAVIGSTYVHGMSKATGRSEQVERVAPGFSGILVRTQSGPVRG